MRFRELFLGALLIPATALTTLACSGGDDVVLAPSTTSSAVTCKVSPGEDICGRTFDLPEKDRAHLVAFLQIAAIFAGEAHEAFERVFAACDAMGRDVGAVGVSIPEADVITKRKASCQAVGKAIESLGAGAFVISAGAQSCTALEAPVCATSSRYQVPARTRCDPPVVTVDDQSGDPKRAAMAASLQRQLPELVWFRHQISQLTTLAHMFVTVGEQPPMACAAESVKLLTTAVAELQAAVEGSALVDVSISVQ